MREHGYDVKERDLPAAGKARLDETLSPLGLAVTETGAEVPDPSRPGHRVDAIWQVNDPDGATRTLEVEALSDAAPHRLRNRLAMFELRRQKHGAEQLLLTNWISPKGRALLDDAGVHCLDLTGTVHLVLDRPRVAVRIDGTPNDPRPPTRRLRGLAGPNAGRLIRVLADVAPPYRPTDLATATGLSPSYITRLLQTLTEHGLITREGRRVTGVSWPDLLEQRATTTALMAAAHTTWIAPRGPDAVLHNLARNAALRDEVVVTGAHAARAVAPLTAGGQLMLYTPAEDIDAPRRVAKALGLLPADEGADVVLLRAPDPAVTGHARTVDGVHHVALPQLVLDCLAGPGRLPAAGQAVLAAIRSDETSWRLPGIDALLHPATNRPPDRHG